MEYAILLIDAVERSTINGFLCATTVTTLYYLIEKSRSKTFARHKITLLLELFEIAPITRSVLAEAIVTGFSDYEDAVVHQAAIAVNSDGIVTRNKKDFKKATIAVYTPEELCAVLNTVK